VRQLSFAPLVAPATALAHNGAGTAGTSFEPWLVALLAVTAIAYARGVSALWRRAGVGRGIRIADAVRFVLGWSVLAAALLSPIDALADRSFALHMIQHELLMVVAAPLLVLSRPLEAWVWALSPSARRVVTRIASVRGVRRAWLWLVAPAVAWTLHAFALWSWHMPALFTAALANDAIHVLQHTFFFVSALVFWWAVFGHRTRAADAAALALLFTTMLHTSALGLLLTFAPRPWYALDGPALFGLTALADQQLGGLIMWVPGSLAYLIAGLVVVAWWLSPARAGQSLGVDAPDQRTAQFVFRSTPEIT